MFKQIRTQMQEARRSGASGFTLIELLIVIVILGVLAGIVVFAVGAFNKDGHTAACKSDVKSVEIAQEAAKAKTGSYDANVGALVTDHYLLEQPSTTYYTVTTNTNGQVLVNGSVYSDPNGTGDTTLCDSV